MAPAQNADAFRDVAPGGSLVPAEEAAIKLEDGVEDALTIKTEDDKKQPNAVLDAIEWPVVTHKRTALTTITPSPELIALIRDAVCICIDDAWEKEKDAAGEYDRLTLVRMDEFDSLIEQAAKEIKPLVCKALGLDPKVAINYIAHVFRVPPDVSITAKNSQFLVIPLVNDTRPGLRVVVNRRGHRPTEDDEIFWPSIQEGYSIYLVDRQARIKGLDDSITFLSIIYVWEDANTPSSGA